MIPRGFPHLTGDFLSSPGTSAACKDLRCRHRTSPPAEEILTSGGTTPNICICKDVYVISTQALLVVTQMYGSHSCAIQFRRFK